MTDIGRYTYATVCSLSIDSSEAEERRMPTKKRKHLSALDVQKRQRIPAQAAPLPSPSSSISEHDAAPLNPIRLALSSSTSMSSARDQDDDGNNRAPTAAAQVSCTSPLSGPQAQAATESPFSHQHHDGDDDAESDGSSWIEVRKQRVLIILPPLPEAKTKPSVAKLPRLRKGSNIPCDSRKGRAVLREDRAVSNKGLLTSKAYDKKKKKSSTNDSRAMETGGKGNGRRAREKFRKDAPPISGMDILLASALGSDHTSWQERRHRHHHIDLLASRTDEDASLDTADSSIRPKSSLQKRVKPVVRNEGAMKLPCKPAHPNRAKNPTGHNGVACFTNALRRPGCVDMKAMQGVIDDASVFSPSQAIRVVTLRKHLEKAGGLKRWLCSLGLGEFKEAFDQRIWSERDLLELQMEDLKHMGKPAVGPRRKLIWAIHHLSQQMV